MKALRRAWIAVALGALWAPLGQATAARALSIVQRPLPAYRCGTGRCPPAPATALLGAGPQRVLAAGVEAGQRVYTEVTLGSGIALTAGPSGAPAYALAPGLDGNPWVLSHPGRGAALQDVTPQGPVTLYEYGPEAKPQALATGLGAAWVADGGVDRIGPGGRLTRFAVPGTIAPQGARELVAGPASSLWFTDLDGAIGQITQDGQVLMHSSEPQPLDPLRAIPQPDGIAAGPDGAVWFTDGTHGRVGRVAADGSVQLFDVPRHSPPYAPGANSPDPTGIVAGPEGAAMYFADPGDNAIGRVTMAGEVSEYAIPALAPVGPDQLVVLGGQLVFDESRVAALGIVDPAGSGGVPVSTPPALDSLAASLRAQLPTAIAAARRGLRRHASGFELAITPPEAGTMRLTWTAPAGGGSRARPTRPVVVAAGEASSTVAAPQAVRVAFTRAGRRLLRHRVRRGGALRVAIRISFSGYWAGPVSVGAGQSFEKF